MYPANLTRTDRLAFSSSEISARDFATESLQRTLNADLERLIWHFPTREAAERLQFEPDMKRISRDLLKNRRAVRSDIEILLSTDQSQSVRGGDKTATAVWWGTDARLLKIDSTHLPLLMAYVSDAGRAPIWLTAFGLIDSIPNSGEADTEIFPREFVPPIEVSDELLEMVRSRSGMITLPTNGVFDSCAPPLVKDCRRMIRGGDATPEAVAVAALASGWWPRHIPALLKKLG